MNTAAPATSRSSILRQPTAVWAIAFACAVSFMGIGLVDPILPAISRELGATPSETMLLFTSYLFITGIAMFFTSWVSSRIGVKRTLLAGLVLVVVFAALAGTSGSVDAIIGFRAGWGLGNALFISTALAAIVGAASGGARQAIVLYEAALGIGLAAGPLIGGALGEVSWRGPFFGTAALMGIALIAILVLLRRPVPAAGTEAGGSPVTEQVSFLASFHALRNPALRSLALVALFYNFGFFVLLAYSPYPMEAAAHAAGAEFGAHELGLVFFGWGLALAITSVLVAPVLTRRLGLRPVLFSMLGGLTVCLALLGVFVHSLPGLVAVVIVSGLLLGVMNTALTEAVMEATDLPRNVASSTYSGVRFMGGAVAPAVAGPLAEALGSGAPYWLGAGSVFIAIAVLALSGRYLMHVGRPHESAQQEAAAISAGDA
ncbi:L-Proline/Glycine betaine transporter ProP [Leucobacter sp. 7(1)]|uniref:MFS transporter n=1 Tax=Leucobacter sp. 7(1) TaxID=1255613 RepID=UPI00097F1BF6|nr:MFS transporter [Leucobacter sp. 7(1)]SJN09484.1 L-Proline/Glycine betaine transporter ProP [Leucobacter sp. 7(1)]